MDHKDIIRQGEEIVSSISRIAAQLDSESPGDRTQAMGWMVMQLVNVGYPLNESGMITALAFKIIDLQAQLKLVSNLSEGDLT